MKVKAVAFTPKLNSKKKSSRSTKNYKLCMDEKEIELSNVQSGKTERTSHLTTTNKKTLNFTSKKRSDNEKLCNVPVQHTRKPTKGINSDDSIVLQPKMVRGAIASIFKIIKEKDKKNEGNTKLLNMFEPIFMQVESVKISMCRKQFRFLVPHSLFNSESDILLITGDKKGHKVFPEKAVEHYSELLAKKNVDFIQKILPCKTLKLEYSQHESKRKLVDQYDVILADNSVIKFLFGWLGKSVNFTKKMPISVRLNTPNLRHHLLNAIRKTQMSVKGTGHTSTVQVGHSGMSEKEVADNIEAVCRGLSADFPGGGPNIRCLTIKTPTSIAVPLYMSLVSPNEVKVAVEQKRKIKPVEGELSTILGATAVVYSDGNVHVKKERDDSLMNNAQDDEILIEVQKHLDSARTIRHDDSDEDSDENNKNNESNDEDMEADAVTDAMEQDVISKYVKASREDQDQSEEDDLGGSDNESAPQKPKNGKSNVKKMSQSSSTNKGVRSTLGGKVKKAKDQSKKNKINKGARKALIKRKKAGKTK